MSHIGTHSWCWDQSQSLAWPCWWVHRHGTWCPPCLDSGMNSTNNTTARVLLLLDRCGSMEEIGDTSWPWHEPGWWQPYKPNHSHHCLLALSFIPLMFSNFCVDYICCGLRSSSGYRWELPTHSSPYWRMTSWQTFMQILSEATIIQPCTILKGWYLCLQKKVNKNDNLSCQVMQHWSCRIGAMECSVGTAS